MAKMWRNAVVGVGVVGDWHVRVINQIANAQLVAVCDPDAAKAQACLDKYNITDVPVYADEAEMLAKQPEIEVVHVATPSGNHQDPAIMAIEAGKHVIVEKPMEITLERIDRIIAAAQKKGVRLAGIFQNRWNKANRALKDAADAGRFGTIAWAGSITPWYRSDQYYREGGWRGTWRLDGGGAVMNQSVHAVDLIQWVVGPVKQVSAYASSRIHAEIEVEDTLSCSLQFQNGAFGTIVGTTAIYPGGAVRLEVGGGDGHAVSENKLVTYKFRHERPEDAGVREQLGPSANKSTSTGGGSSPTDVATDLHVQNVQHVLDSWAAGRDADTNGPEARKAVAIILAMYESAKKNGQPVEVK